LEITPRKKTTVSKASKQRRLVEKKTTKSHQTKVVKDNFIRRLKIRDF